MSEYCVTGALATPTDTMGAGLSRQQELSDALFWKRHYGAWSQSKIHLARSHGGQLLHGNEDASSSSWQKQHGGGMSDGRASCLSDSQAVERSKLYRGGELRSNGDNKLCGALDPRQMACVLPLEVGQVSQAGGTSANYNGSGGGNSQVDGMVYSFGGGNSQSGSSSFGGQSRQSQPGFGSKFGHPGQTNNPGGGHSIGGSSSQEDGMVHSCGGGHSHSQEEGMVHSFGGLGQSGKFGGGEAARQQPGCGKGRARGRGFGRVRSSTGQIVCYKCGNVGHIAARCQTDVVKVKDHGQKEVMEVFSSQLSVEAMSVASDHSSARVMLACHSLEHIQLFV